MDGRAFSLAFSGPFTGYRAELEKVSSALESGAQFVLVRGPPGAGKTAFLKALQQRLARSHYLPALPAPDALDAIFTSLAPRRFHFFHRPARSAHQLPKLAQRTVLLIDNCEGELLLLRAFADASSQLAFILAAGSEWQPPASIAERIECEVRLAGLAPAEFREMLKQRIVACGGQDIEPLTSEAVAAIHQRCSGLPLQGLRLCSELWQQAQQKGLSTVDLRFLEIEPSPLQRQILDTLALVGPLTPTELADSLDGYKDRANAVRAVNNLLFRLHRTGLVCRERSGRSYRYAPLGPSVVPAMLK